MKRLFSQSRLAGSILLLVALVPGIAAAQGATSEVVSIQIDFTTPLGTKIIGTAVGRRSLIDPVHTDVTFSGMINGAPASAHGEIIERWTSATAAEIEVVKIDQWQAAVPQPARLTLHITQDTPGLILGNGVPVALDRPLQAPGHGSQAYFIANSGRGRVEIN
jgi:hypothetical protein